MGTVDSVAHHAHRALSRRRVASQGGPRASFAACREGNRLAAWVTHPSPSAPVWPMRSAAPPKPSKATIAVTRRCNSRCAYCPSSRTVAAPDPDLPTLVGLLGDLARLGVKSVSLSGGEPLMRADLEDIVAAANGFGMGAVILTNGSLLDEERAESLLEAGTRGFVLSLDTLDATAYRALRGREIASALAAASVLSSLRRRSPRPFTCVTAVIARATMGHLAELAAWARDADLALQVQPCHGAADLAIAPDDERLVAALERELAAVTTILADSLSEEDLQYLQHIPDYLRTARPPAGFACRGPSLVVHIDARLDVFPCWVEDTVGNARRTPIAELWTGGAMEAARRRAAQGACRGCWLLCDIKPTIAAHLNAQLLLARTTRTEPVS